MRPDDHRERCRAEELRTLPLFEGLTAPQRELLCGDGHIATRAAGPLCVEGQSATQFYVLIDGDAVISKRAGGVDVDISRTAERGAFFGAWSARLVDGEHHYDASVRLTKPSRLFVMDAAAFDRFVRTYCPMALDLRDGHLIDGVPKLESLEQRERLLALGTLTAGLTDQLRHAAGALDREFAGLRDDIAELRRNLAENIDGTYTPEALRVLFSIEDDVAEQAAKYAQQVKPVAGQPYVAPLTSSEAADRHDQIVQWLRDHGIAEGQAWASTFVDGGMDVCWLERVAASVDEVGVSGSLANVFGRLNQTIDTELHMSGIAEACERISALLAGVKQYSQMDRGVYQSVDVHELLRSTGVMFGNRIAMPGKGKPVTLVKETDLSLPEILCYPGDLNQVWTNIFDNAVQAMDGHGTLTVRTMWEGDAMIRVEICDDGPGIPDDIMERIFTPFFTTSPHGAAAGLGLDLARRIVVEKHHGTIAVQSTPGDTRVIVCLPLRAPAPTVHGHEDVAQSD